MSDITSTWNLKYDTNEPIYKTETDLPMQEADYWLAKRKGGINYEFEFNRDTQLYITQISKKVLLYSTGNCVQYLIITYNGKESEKKNIYMCVYTE